MCASPITADARNFKNVTNMEICDVLIIGSGVAGLSLAIKLSQQFPKLRIFVITKGDELESNTRYAQGGVSVVCDFKSDSFEQHIQDTLAAGAGLCKMEVVESVIRYGQKALVDLMKNGVTLDREINGDYMLGREGGHSQSRIVHYKDMTGFQITVSLLLKAKTLPGITLLSNYTAIDLITSRQMGNALNQIDECNGVFALNDKAKRIEKFISRMTVIATGGVGQVYATTTNPKIATGDGIGMAHRAGAAIGNMEFIQFHPTAFYSENSGGQKFLVSEAIRGYGAFLRNFEGERFMFKYDSQGELACRDVVSRAIEHEMILSGHPYVFIDCTHLPSDSLKREFPKIFSHCTANGIDMTAGLVPVHPAAHYLCGGINVDAVGRTSVDKLYALGECANTGLHGANRLASNSLLEALAFAEFCFRDIEKIIHDISININTIEMDYSFQVGCHANDTIHVLRKRVQNVMSKYVGVNRTTKGLRYALGYLQLAEKRLEDFYPRWISAELLELRNILIAAKLIVVQSLNRKVNKGAFYNVDLDPAFVSTSNKLDVSHG
jgi:L-aspartate oxidase